MKLLSKEFFSMHLLSKMLLLKCIINKKFTSNYEIPIKESASLLIG